MVSKHGEQEFRPTTCVHWITYLVGTSPGCNVETVVCYEPAVFACSKKARTNSINQKYLAPAPSDSLPHCMCPHRVPHLHDRQSIGYRGCSSVTLHVTAVVRQEQGRLHELFQLVCDQNERLTVTDADVPTMSG
jgi:hypothetical protein